jgi:hypothetical protein
VLLTVKEHALLMRRKRRESFKTYGSQKFFGLSQVVLADQNVKIVERPERHIFVQLRSEDRSFQGDCREGVVIEQSKDSCEFTFTYQVASGSVEKMRPKR